MLAHRLPRWPSIKAALVQNLVFAELRVWQCMPQLTRDSFGLMLGQRRRWWTNIKLTLAQCIVLAGHIILRAASTSEHRHNVLNVGPALGNAGQYPFSPSQYFMLTGLRAHSIHRPNAV